MSFTIDYEIGLRLLISFALGAAIGLEREYNSKAAGLRTMIMICLGSTIFTEISIMMGGTTPDRIASNIVTGVGFLGAGVIFKDGLSITGITTATTIWISAALGMAVGAGEYFISVVSACVIIIVLSVFNKVQFFIEKLHQTRMYKIGYESSLTLEETIEKEILNFKLGFFKKRVTKDKTHFTVVYEITGSEKRLDEFNSYLKKNDQFTSFEY
ncbi:MAG: MgtC/SapB family protein [Cyclobacteriaceae bacterium]|nr:MgtC/SapB family protein [Cyclobacteriaceae bacterium]